MAAATIPNLIPMKKRLSTLRTLTRDADTFLYGRKTYQLMVPYWPDVAKNHSGQTKADYEFARAFDAVDKIIVFSQSLDSPEGKKAQLFVRAFTTKYLN
jgi:hypothetical protein